MSPAPAELADEGKDMLPARLQSIKGPAAPLPEALGAQDAQRCQRPCQVACSAQWLLLCCKGFSAPHPSHGLCTKGLRATGLLTIAPLRSLDKIRHRMQLPLWFAQQCTFANDSKAKVGAAENIASSPDTPAASIRKL